MTLGTSNGEPYLKKIALYSIQMSLCAECVYPLIVSQDIDDFIQEKCVAQSNASAGRHSNATNYLERHILAFGGGKKPKVFDPSVVCVWPVREFQNILRRFRHC